MITNNYFFFGEDLVIKTGLDAKTALAEINDSKYVEINRGICCVPRDRWLIAQSYEKRTWMDAGAHASDDRNYDHAVHFNRYYSIEGQHYFRAIELGCGPFTNLRIIADHCHVDKCVLVDPLIPDYLQHRNCRYRHGMLQMMDSYLSSFLGQNIFTRPFRRLLRLFFPKVLFTGVPIEALVATSIEEMPELGAFDLIVIINVLEHCYDIKKIFDKILELSTPGTTLVFSDKLYNANDVLNMAAMYYDAGHPLKLDKLVILEFLQKNFIPIFQKEMMLQNKYNDVDLSENVIYFIGKRKS